MGLGPCPCRDHLTAMMNACHGEAQRQWALCLERTELSVAAAIEMDCGPIG